MKPRPDGFLSGNEISHDSEIFDYIRELHDYLWQFVRVFRPGVFGYLDDFIDDVLATAKEKGKIVAIMGGGDWADASVEHLMIPKDMDIDQAYNDYNIDIRRPNARWVSFAEWLMQHGARNVTDSEVFEFWEI